MIYLFNIFIYFSSEKQLINPNSFWKFSQTYWKFKDYLKNKSKTETMKYSLYVK